MNRTINEVFQHSMKTHIVALGLCLLLSTSGVLADCTVNAIAVAFGNYEVFSSAHLDSTGRIDVDCSNPASYTISLSAGNASFAQRQLLNGANFLYYNLYTNATRTTIWGDGTGVTSLLNGSGVSASYTVYGRIPALQNNPPGQYSDTIVITVTF